MRAFAGIALALLLGVCGISPVAAHPANAASQGGVTSSEEGDTASRFGAASSHLKLFDEAAMEGELDSMQDAGIGMVRCDFAWSDLEPVEGSWNLAGADLVVEKAGEHGVSVLGILGTSPPWANGGMAWNYPPTDIDAWKTYVFTVVSRYAGEVEAWEVWNEENIHAFWQPEPNAADYVALLAAASPEIRAADPEATIVMGGVAGLDPDYLDACLSLGAADYVDAIAYHPYAETMGVEGQPEEDLLKPKEALSRFLVEFVHWLVSQYSTRDLEVWITEVGWTTCAETPPGVDEDTQAAYMLRTLINYATTDADRVIWFNLRDTLLNAWDYYGLLSYGFAPKPSYGCFSTFIDVFGPATAVEDATVSFTCADPSTLEAHCFSLPDGKLAIAAWKSDDGADTLAFSVSDPAYQVVNGVDPVSGERSAITAITRDDQDRITVTDLAVGKTPLIVELETGSPPPPPGPDASTFYFAEGYTGEGFQEYLCLGNMDDVDAAVRVEFLFPDGGSDETWVSVPAGFRATVNVNAAVGADREVSMVVASEQDIVAERPMYFSYGDGWTGGHDVMGAQEPATSSYFAEGYTGEGFDEWLCILNPGDTAADLTFRFQTQEEGEREIGGFTVGPHSRASFKVNDILGRNLQASCVVEASRAVVVERPMYFAYRGRSGHAWQGGHCVMGAAAPSTRFLFAEGTTRTGFEQWLTIQNPQASAIDVQAVYRFGPGQGDQVARSYRLEGESRTTLFVPDEVGREKDVAVELTSQSAFLAERPLYFDYAGTGTGHWQGGHCVIGSGAAASAWYFAEGYTGEGFHEWLCLQNPGDAGATVRIDYLTQEAGALPARWAEVPADTRLTVFVNDDAGRDYQLAVSLTVTSGPDIVVERPMYFACKGGEGGHDVVGYAP
ncbi:MAG: cellulase family glycosylhydrolase [Actinobacteria bacterium]|nr:cellulase family glycosylhydrolase [Actinomycetota bacterium]